MLSHIFVQHFVSIHTKGIILNWLVCDLFKVLTKWRNLHLQRVDSANLFITIFTTQNHRDQKRVQHCGDVHCLIVFPNSSAKPKPKRRYLTIMKWLKLLDITHIQSILKKKYTEKN